MAAPWTATSKFVALSGQTGRTHPAAPGPSFVPAPLTPAISFPPPVLYAALAKTTALGSASAPLLAALTRSDQALIEAIVDDVGVDFLFTADAAQLGPDIRKALAGRIGAALCHIYMDQLGYSWVDYANAYITTPSPLADFLYDGVSLGSTGLALAEAKGSLSVAASVRTVKATADSAYTRQVTPHLGATTPVGRIEYGCAIASAILPARHWTPGRTSCFLHVTQTVPPVAGGGGAVPPAAPALAGDVLEVNSLLALRNYRAVFRLIDAPFMVDFIDSVIAGQAFGREVVQRFGRLMTDGPNRWIVGDGSRYPAALSYNRANRLVTGEVFALEERSFRAITELVRRCAENPQSLFESYHFPNLAVGRRLIRGVDGPTSRYEDTEDPSQAALFGDGLAVVRYKGAWYPDGDNFVWTG